MGNRVVHFEIEATDSQALKKFYQDAFGWEMDQMGEEMGGYVVVKTGDPKEPGGINGGIYQAQDGKKQTNAYRCVIAVDDIKKAMDDVKAAGGKVFGEPMPIPGVGDFVSCEDPQGNQFTLLKPSGEMQ